MVQVAVVTATIGTMAALATYAVLSNRAGWTGKPMAVDLTPPDPFSPDLQLKLLILGAKAYALFSWWTKPKSETCALVAESPYECFYECPTMSWFPVKKNSPKSPLGGPQPFPMNDTCAPTVERWKP